MVDEVWWSDYTIMVSLRWQYMQWLHSLLPPAHCHALPPQQIQGGIHQDGSTGSLFSSINSWISEWVGGCYGATLTSLLLHRSMSSKSFSFIHHEITQQGLSSWAIWATWATSATELGLLRCFRMFRLLWLLGNGWFLNQWTHSASAHQRPTRPCTFWWCGQAIWRCLWLAVHSVKCLHTRQHLYIRCTNFVLCSEDT